MTDAEQPGGARPTDGPRPGEPPPTNGNVQARSIWGLPLPAFAAEQDGQRKTPEGLPLRRPGGTLKGMPDILREPVPPDPEAARKLLAALTQDTPED